MKPDTAFIGAGNVAFRFALAMQEKGYNISAVYSRTAKSRDRLAKALRANGSETQAVESIRDLRTASLVIVAVTDNAIPQVVREIADAFVPFRDNPLPAVVHTSGATPLSVLQPLAELGCPCGVIYPLMTLNRNKNVEFRLRRRALFLFFRREA